jgi:hypothetical protein
MGKLVVELEPEEECCYLYQHPSLSGNAPYDGSRVASGEFRGRVIKHARGVGHGSCNSQGQNRILGFSQ